MLELPTSRAMLATAKPLVPIAYCAIRPLGFTSHNYSCRMVSEENERCRVGRFNHQVTFPAYRRLLKPITRFPQVWGFAYDFAFSATHPSCRILATLYCNRHHHQTNPCQRKTLTENRTKQNKWFLLRNFRFTHYTGSPESCSVSCFHFLLRG